METRSRYDIYFLLNLIKIDEIIYPSFSFPLLNEIHTYIDNIYYDTLDYLI